MDRTLGSDLFVEQSPVSTRDHQSPKLLATLLLWKRRIVSRHQLARLDERLLTDAGISLMQRAREVRKPFWR
uniref:YjiS-like domain-containing protein n=1 Tax=Pseudomonas sp. 19-rlim TaxID=1084570 RepID=G3LH28_9PSED|nr:hypothetical protein [Pseudomonas sp. 19-rlim]